MTEGGGRRLPPPARPALDSPPARPRPVPLFPTLLPVLPLTTLFPLRLLAGFGSGCAADASAAPADLVAARDADASPASATRRRLGAIGRRDAAWTVHATSTSQGVTRVHKVGIS